jgi:hypothetical protein
LAETGKNSTETFKMLEVLFEEQEVERTEVFEWFLKFRSSVEDSEHGMSIDEQNR